MPGLTVVHGSLLDSKLQILGHQCNCRTSSARGLARDLFERYPYANIYKQKDRIPGTNKYSFGDGPIIVGMLAQDYPGRSQGEDRLRWFRECLSELKRFMKEHSLDTVGFPHGIGCGLAGGRWEDYLALLTEFAKNYNVVLYRK